MLNFIAKTPLILAQKPKLQPRITNVAIFKTDYTITKVVNRQLLWRRCMYTWVGHRPATEGVVDLDPRGVATPVPLRTRPTVSGAIIVRVPEGAQ